MRINYVLRSITPQLPIIIALLPYYALPGIISDMFCAAVLCFWTTARVAYLFGKNEWPMLKNQLLIIGCVIALINIPDIWRGKPIREFWLYDDISSIQIELFADEGFKSTSYCMGFYDTWSGSYTVKKDTIIFNNPYYDAGGDNSLLIYDRNKRYWVRSIDDLKKSLHDYEYFKETSHLN